MSELGKKVFGAAQAVENTLASTVKDFESGIGAFCAGLFWRKRKIQNRDRGSR